MRRLTPGLAACLLAAPVPSAAAEPYRVVSRCEWALKTIPDSNQMLLVIVAEAHATGPVPAVTTLVQCVVRTVYGEELVARGVSAGPDVYSVSSRVMRYDPPTACSWSSALFLDPAVLTVTHSEVEQEHCAP